MPNQASLALKPLGTLDAVIQPQTRQILSRLSLLVLLQMPGGAEVSLDLVEIAIV